MRRFLLVLSAAALGPAVRADSDDRDREFIPIQIIQVPQNYFSASFNYSGRLTATFNNLGTISSARDIGDTTSEYSRGYDDGYVYKDTRLTGNGEDVPDDGRTNTWSYLYGTQVTEDQRFIAFHTYSAISEGATMEGEASEGAGVDLEYSRQLQSFGRYRFGEEPKLSWGVLAGVTTAGANAKTEGEITATLRTVTDLYSLIGATPPEPGYVAPSTTSETVADANGTTGTVTVNNTTHLANRPDSRTESTVAGGAKIRGFWQVRGAYYTFRAGAWVRWQPTRKLALRASVGPTVTWLGVHLRYNERLDVTNLRASDEIYTEETTKDTSYTIPGVFGSADLEYWITRRTALFVTGTYETYSKDVSISASTRRADVTLTSGFGFRIGVTTRF